MLGFAQLFLKFIIFSFIGYIGEVLYCSYLQKKLVNRGFLVGPICPIYGLGALLMLWCLSSFKDNVILLFFLGMILTSCLEYYTSYIFEKIFNNKWWDYSDKPFNLNGRVCLSNSIYFGLGGVLLMYVFDPLVNNLLNIPDNILITLFIIIFILLIIDIIFSAIIAYNLRNSLIVAEELKSEKIKMIPKIFENAHFEQLSKIKFKSNRLIKVYPNLAKDLRKELSTIKNMISNIKLTKKNVKKVSKNKKN